jgi:hypothetical protein
MISPMSRHVALAAILLLFNVTEAAAQTPERYQAIPLTKSNEMGTEVLIIDLKTGDVWKWFEGSSGAQAGSGIRYEGAVVPGRTPGEIVARQGFGLPAMQQRPAGK